MVAAVGSNWTKAKEEKKILNSKTTNVIAAAAENKQRILLKIFQAWG